jgi:Sulfotransferase domain
MRVHINLTFFPEARPALMVVTHERSGTHFLMNALAACYGYVNAPWLNLDQTTLNINYYHPPEISQALLSVASQPIANIVKSHHPTEFFAEELARLTERYIVFTICRDPVAVLLSNWRFVHRWPWFEGPKAADPLTFARAAPCGRMMRYQMHQHPTMMHRWAAHVEGWLAAAAVLPRVVVVRYEDLDTHYEDTIRSFAGILGRPPQALLRPARDVNVVPGGPADPTGSGIPPATEALRRLCRETIGGTMARLGY